MLYITLLDQFHPGIYSSQVVDVCDYLNEKHHAKIRVVAFLSIKELMKSKARKKLKRISPTAIVLPSFPGLKNFELTAVFLFLVCLFTGERIAICRNVFCTKMALTVKNVGMLKKVVMDGRSAMAAEICEYDVFPVDYLRNNVAAFEYEAVNKSDFRISVSEKLIEYWKEKYKYLSNKHVVIPCTLDRKYFNETEFVVNSQKEEILKELGFDRSDIILVYSGSNAPWQSFKILEETITPLLKVSLKVKLLFLARESKELNDLKEIFKGRIIIKWLEHEKILSYLQCCDYGMLVREQSETNKVASPVKFAEYLYAGLNVIISKNVGDLSEFVKKHKCGLVIGDCKELKLEKMKPEERESCFNLAATYFKKEAIENDLSYRRLITFLKPN